MRISVFGMGYVGSVTAACLADQGHTVVGVDVNPAKVDRINSGQPPVLEVSLDRLISVAVQAGRLRATCDAREAVEATDLSLVCVGTPSMKSGRLDLGGVEKVSREVGRALKGKAAFHTIAIRSTILPGTIHTLVTPAIEAESGKTAGKDFVVCFNPEFMREGTAVADYHKPPFTVIGTDDPAKVQSVTSLYEGLGGQIVVTDVRLAEMLKYTCNAYHALKVAFANEVGVLARAVGVDSHALMQVFCQDSKLNISKAYLEPGFAFGGSCLPKDLRAMLYRAKELDLKLPVLEAVLPSNELHVARAFDLVMGLGRKRIGILGLSFKANTDDLRESPILTLVKALIGEGCQLRIYDPHVKLSALVGANRQFLEETIPHIGMLLEASLEAVLRDSEVIVVSRDGQELRSLSNAVRPDQVVVELVRCRNLETGNARLIGLAR